MSVGEKLPVNNGEQCMGDKDFQLINKPRMLKHADNKQCRNYPFIEQYPSQRAFINLQIRHVEQ